MVEGSVAKGLIQGENEEFASLLGFCPVFKFPFTVALIKGIISSPTALDDPFEIRLLKTPFGSMFHI